eukprot:297311_1
MEEEDLLDEPKQSCDLNRTLQTKWKISNFTSLQRKERVYSPLFSLGELKWRLLLFPEGTSGHNGHKTHVSVFLKLANPHEWSVTANFGLHVVAACGSIVAKHNGKHQFDTEIDDQGWDKLISLADLERSCLKFNNEVTIGVYVNVKSQVRVGDFSPNKGVSSEAGVIEYGNVMLRIVTEKDMCQHAGLELLDRTDIHEIPVNLNDHLTLNSFRKKIHEMTGILPDRQQFWNYTRRQNGTYRPNKKLNLLQMTKQVQKDATYFVRDCDANFPLQHPAIFPCSNHSGLEKLIFVKYFDCERGALRFVGSVIADRGETMSTLMQRCCDLIGLPPDTSVDMYEEENACRMEIPHFGTRLSYTLAECQIVTGDIITIQKCQKKLRNYQKCNAKEFLLLAAADKCPDDENLQTFKHELAERLELRKALRAAKRRRKRQSQRARRKARESQPDHQENPDKAETPPDEMSEEEDSAIDAGAGEPVTAGGNGVAQAVVSAGDGDGDGTDQHGSELGDAVSRQRRTAAAPAVTLDGDGRAAKPPSASTAAAVHLSKAEVSDSGASDYSSQIFDDFGDPSSMIAAECKTASTGTSSSARQRSKSAASSSAGNGTGIGSEDGDGIDSGKSNGSATTVTAASAMRNSRPRQQSGKRTLKSKSAKVERPRVTLIGENKTFTISPVTDLDKLNIDAPNLQYKLTNTATSYTVDYARSRHRKPVAVVVTYDGTAVSAGKFTVGLAERSAAPTKRKDRTKNSHDRPAQSRSAKRQPEPKGDRSLTTAANSHDRSQATAANSHDRAAVTSGPDSISPKSTTSTVSMSSDVSSEMKSAVRSSEETVRPADRVKRPSDRSTRPSNRTPRPSNHVTRPAKDAVRSSSNVPRSSNRSIQSSNDAKRPSDQGVRSSKSVKQQSDWLEHASEETTLPPNGDFAKQVPQTPPSQTGKRRRKRVRTRYRNRSSGGIQQPSASGQRADQAVPASGQRADQHNYVCSSPSRSSSGMSDAIIDEFDLDDLIDGLLPAKLIRRTKDGKWLAQCSSRQISIFPGTFRHPALSPGVEVLIEPTKLQIRGILRGAAIANGESSASRPGQPIAHTRSSAATRPPTRPYVDRGRKRSLSPSSSNLQSRRIQLDNSERIIRSVSLQSSSRSAQKQKQPAGKRQATIGSSWADVAQGMHPASSLESVRSGIGSGIGS